MVFTPPIIAFQFQHTATRRWLQVFPTPYHSPVGVSTHSHPKVAAIMANKNAKNVVFQHTATRRWLPPLQPYSTSHRKFQHTATRRWLQNNPTSPPLIQCFNTQPPEGGCSVQYYALTMIAGFNTQPPEGGCFHTAISTQPHIAVSTHSHPKVAAQHID